MLYDGSSLSSSPCYFAGALVQMHCALSNASYVVRPWPGSFLLPPFLYHALENTVIHDDPSVCRPSSWFSDDQHAPERAVRIYGGSRSSDARMLAEPRLLCRMLDQEEQDLLEALFQHCVRNLLRLNTLEPDLHSNYEMPSIDESLMRPCLFQSTAPPTLVLSSL